MIHFRSIFYLVGWLLIILAGAMLLPAFVDFFRNSLDYKTYLVSSCITAFLGTLLMLSNKSETEIEFEKKDTFLLISIAWAMTILFSSLPFLFSSLEITATDAFFETVSGLTTTGATALKNLDTLPWGILLWRSVLQWLGGIGVVIMALTLLADMKIGGMELFQTESSDRSEKFLPRVTQIGNMTLIVYVLLTFLCFLSLWAGGMSIFDAVCHSFSTLSTGGFSTHDDSIAYFESPTIQLILVFFMFLGGTTQVLFVHLGSKNWRRFFMDQQLQVYTKILMSALLILIIWKLITSDEDIFSVFLKTIFNVTSSLTTTGFETINYNKWGGFPLIVFFLLPFIGECTGSTAGGIKIFRYQVLWEVICIQLKKLWRPHGIFLPKYNGKKLPDTIFDSVASFFVLFMFSYTGLTLILSFLGLDFTTSVSVSGSMITGVGSSCGDSMNPQAYTKLSDPIKWTLMTGMILGRLELLTILVLFSPSFWKA